MEDFISNLIANKNASFIGGMTLAPGPVAASSRVHGPVVVSAMESVATSGTLEHGVSQSPQPFAVFNNNAIPSLPSAISSTSILRTDMSPMIAWLTSQNNCGGANSQAFGTSLNSQAYESYTSEDYVKRIPKPYIELTERDCAGVVAQAIRSIVLHTTNDEFRHQCLTKLGASNSRDVEREVRSRLHAIIAQEEQQNQSDSENLEMDQSTVSDIGSTTTGLTLQ